MMFLSKFQKSTKILIVSLEIELSLFDFVIVPHNVNTERVHPHGLDHHNTMLPVLDRNPRVVYLPRIQFRTLLRVVATRVDVWLHRLFVTAVMQVRSHTCDEYEKHRGHCSLFLEQV